MSNVVEFFKKLLSTKTKDITDPDITAEDCMISRANIPVIYLDSSTENIKKAWTQERQVFLVVCDDGLDDIIGVADVFSFDWNTSVRDQRLVRPAFITQNTELKTFCLDLFQLKQLYVVVDEFGGTKGIVTVESVLAYVLNFSQEITKSTHNDFLVDGKMPLKSLLQMIELDIELEEFDSKTVGGFVMEYLGKIPKLRESFFIGNVELIIEELNGRQIKTVKIKHGQNPLS